MKLQTFVLAMCHSSAILSAIFWVNYTTPTEVGQLYRLYDIPFCMLVHCSHSSAVFNIIIIIFLVMYGLWSAVVTAPVR